MKAIFLTGGSGVLGRALREQLRQATLYCLVHRSPVDGPNVVPLTGDISRPRLGLTRSEYTELAGRIDLVIHTAAITDFEQPPDLFDRTNIDGVRNVLELARAANVPLYYIGTAFSDGPGYFSSNPYQRSKRAAEEIVRASDVPAVILRPSIIVGDSVTGAIGRSQGFHLLIDLLCRGLLPFVIMTPKAHIDFVPQDLVARVIAALVARSASKGDYWLTLGGRALAIRRVVDLCIEKAARLTRKTIHRPREISPDMFERLIRPVFLSALPPDIRSSLDRAVQFVKFCNIEAAFPTSLPALESELDLGQMPSPELTLMRNLEYWIGRNRSASSWAMS